MCPGIPGYCAQVTLLEYNREPVYCAQVFQFTGISQEYEDCAQVDLLNVSRDTRIFCSGKFTGMCPGIPGYCA